MGGGWIFAVIVVGLIVAALWAFTKGTPTGRQAGSGSGSSDEVAQLRKNLRVKALGNDALVNRLVQAERNRMPGASEAACYKAAIESWERDNR
ncbi:hypothetical protein [Singulisphaera acidiphila]|uniref:Uncharacterized protein n=1 Tax=Singulisphaera acidiphila (strain ATCC BAA-1392 / DSM 18658 / VKM B-2454 / MOB10) TaxID=886293 RepID=L0DFP4_SINAD|nr:hypothetical protein [Singulisphaera acidiphila]AGA27476.1 hypothetical protein Sinac_3203 [Singulisphaera acidiphila DSM 18658]